MPNEHRARLDASGRSVAIVASRFNDVVTKRVVDGAVEGLKAHGIEDGAIHVYWVSGAFEVPQLAAQIAREKKVDGARNIYPHPRSAAGVSSMPGRRPRP